MLRVHSAPRCLRVALLTFALAAVAAPALAYPGMGSPSGATSPPAAASRIVYDCPRAGCDYESTQPGTCPRHKVKLQKIAMLYTCPKDGDPVAGPGPCPRCAMDAVPHKLAVMDGKADKAAARKAAHHPKPHSARPTAAS
ncbi:MAG TPA: hypothetical protein VMS93_08100 [Candidatus Saccharimonadales bacterium]|nr:hypothetical protein [Candidatus Saccharimonadales bacterium]